MKNIDNKEIVELSKQGELLYDLYNKSSEWVDRNLKYEEKNSLLTKIKENRCDVRKINYSIESKPVFALFGGSQVGKSYLVKNLLSIDGNPLEICFGDKRYDFLKEINPQGGGAESTGVVTRFSISKDFPKDFPVLIKLLNAKDLLILLCDSFFSDLKKFESYPSQLEFKDFISLIEEKYLDKTICQHNFIEDDIWEIKEYFNTNFNKFSHFTSEINKSGYWNRLGEVIQKIPYQEWPNTFEILWGKSVHLTKLFAVLVENLQNLNHSRSVWAPEASILREGGQILDVQKLKGILNSSESFTVLTGEETIEISSSILSALTAELTLPIDPEIAKNKSFLKNTDLLDFPGARGRLQLDFVDINEKSIIDMFLRGKISYLFNKYSSNYEINNLLFCLKDEQIEVNEIPELLNNWISRNIGKDNESREKRIGNLPSSPLYVVFTFFNNQLIYDSTNDDKGLSYKWDNRFQKFFQKQIITTKYDWDRNWTKSNPNFKNFFLLRDYKYSSDTFDGFVENQKETEVNKSRVEHLTKLEKSFLDYPFVQNHFSNPQESWGKSATINNDGSELIIEKLEPSANNYIKIKNYVEKLKDYNIELIDNLVKHHHSDNLKVIRDKAFRLGLDLQFGLNHLFENTENSIGLFMQKMMLQDTDVYNLIHDNLLKSNRSVKIDMNTVFRSQFPDLSNSKTKAENLKIIQGYIKVDSIEEVETYLKEKEIDLDKVLENKVATTATLLVDKLIAKWKDNINIENFISFTEKGLKQSTFDSLSNNLFLTFDSLNLRDKLITIFEQKTKMLTLPEETEEQLASISSDFFNDFVANFGFNFMQTDRINELKEIAQEYQLDISSLFSEQKNIREDDLINIFDNNHISDAPLINSFNNYILKIKLALLSNCGFVNYNVNANNEINTLLSGLDQIEFKIQE